MSSDKKTVRRAFRDAVFARDRNTCRGCGLVATASTVDELMDPHHITDRHAFANGGYVAANGITLCKARCHELAEQLHRTGAAAPGFSPDELYAMIRSSRVDAVAADARLGAKRRSAML